MLEECGQSGENPAPAIDGQSTQLNWLALNHGQSRFVGIGPARVTFASAQNRESRANTSTEADHQPDAARQLAWADPEPPRRPRRPTEKGAPPTTNKSAPDEPAASKKSQPTPASEPRSPKRDLTPSQPRDSKRGNESVGNKRSTSVPTDWAEFFEKQRPSPDMVRTLVDELSESRQPEAVIGLIEQALIAGQPQPWMYEVLALSLEMAGRPEEDVERALLSSTDVLRQDAGSLMFVAACLTRFDRSEQALRMYHQASQLEPTREEPYVLALELAERVGNDAAIRWAAPGLLLYGWSRPAREQQSQALRLAEALIARDRKAGNDADAEDLAEALQQSRQRDLIVRLEWAGEGDLELLVDEPSGSTCSAALRRTPGGGIYTHDGFGPRSQNCYEEYLCPIAWTGEYKARVQHSWGKIVGQRARLIITRNAGSPDETVIEHSIELAEEEQVVRFRVTSGRRESAMSIPTAQLPTNQPFEIAAANAAHGRQAQPGGPAVLRFAPAGGVVGVAGRAAPAMAIVGPVAGGNGFQVQAQFGGGTPLVTGAVGFQPVVTVVPSGVQLAAGAVVSADQRYVRINAAPVFSSISDVFTFSFVR